MRCLNFFNTYPPRDPTRDGWIKQFIERMKFLAVLGSRGCREKKLPTAISMQLFGVGFSTFVGKKKKIKNILKIF